MNAATSNSKGWAARNSSNTLRLALWTFAWLTTVAVLAFGPKFLWDYATAPSAVAAIVNLAVGIGMVLTNRRHLRDMDELERKIFLDASALTLGVGLVFAGAYQLLGDIRLLPFEPKIAHLMIVMSLAFLVGMIVGHRKFS